MCGIVGFANLNPWASNARQSWFEKALIVDQIRGHHSTGVITVPKFTLDGKAPKPMLYKAAVDASAFMQMEEARKLCNHIDDAAVVIGHNRWATVGKINGESAHPFYTKKIGMVHNGTLDNRTGLEFHHEVYSAAIAMQLHATEPENYTGLLSELEGAFALVWFNEENNTLYLTRNDERPLYVAQDKTKKTLFFASEGWMISELMRRSHYGLIIDEDPWEIEDGVLYETCYHRDTPKLEFKKTKYTPKPTWTGVLKNSKKYSNVYDFWSDGDYDDYGDYYTRKYRAPVYEVSKNGKATPACPVIRGEEIYMDRYDWVPYKTNKQKGSMIGVDPDHKGISIVVPNVTETEWTEFLQLLSYTQDTSDPEEEVVCILGKVAAIDPIKDQGKWVATIPYKDLYVDTFSLTGFEEEEEEDTEKKQ